MTFRIGLWSRIYSVLVRFVYGITVLRYRQYVNGAKRTLEAGQRIWEA